MSDQVHEEAVNVPAPPAPAATGEIKPWGMDEKTFCMLMHLSLLTSFLIPFAGLILPIVMWLTNKDSSAKVDAHGRVVMNWVVSAFIYGIVAGILVLIIIGFFLLIAIGICTLVFAIMGAVKASDNKLWNYPLSIAFFGKPNPNDYAH